MYVIKNGLVKTMEGPDIPEGDVLIKDGKIVAVGKKIEPPLGAEIINASGCIVAPGFVEAHCHTGLREDGIKIEGEDNNEIPNDPVCPQTRAIDACNPMDTAFFEALTHGVTSAVITTGSLNVIGGQAAAIKTYGKRIDNMIIKTPVAVKIAFGENVKGAYGSRGKTPFSRLGTAAILREALFKAKAYKDAKESKEHVFDLKMEALLPVLRREIPFKAHAHRADDIFTVLRIANEFGVDLTLDHCTEGHLIADELVKEGKPVIVGPILTARSKYELRNATPESARVLYEVGLKIAITTDAPVIPLKFLAMSAGYAVRAGLPEEAAWKAVTINPAEIVGICDRVGSLREGKDADVVIFRGNPLMESAWSALKVFINGEPVYTDPIDNEGGAK